MGNNIYNNKYNKLDNKKVETNVSPIINYNSSDNEKIPDFPNSKEILKKLEEKNQLFKKYFQEACNMFAKELFTKCLNKILERPLIANHHSTVTKNSISFFLDLTDTILITNGCLNIESIEYSFGSIISGDYDWNPNNNSENVCLFKELNIKNPISRVQEILRVRGYEMAMYPNNYETNSDAVVLIKFL